MTKDEAIRAAKLQYLKEHTGALAHPALWACLVQFGDYTPIAIYTNNNRWLFSAIVILLVILIVSFFFIKKRNTITIK